MVVGLTILVLVLIAALVASWGVNVRARRVANDTAATLRMVAGVAHDIASKPDARSSICAATMEMVGSAFAGLWEVQPGNRISVSAMEGVAVPPGISVQIGKEPSGAAIAYLSGMRYFTSDANENPAISQKMVELTGARSLLFEPVLRGDDVVAVLVVGWTRDVREITPRQGSIITLLADEAAVAIERSDMVAQLAALARTDPLTGLANRRVWEERLPIEIARAHRTREPLGLLVVDLDDFKAVNDEFGHQAGDRMLKEVAAAWREVIRPTDLLARFGGDEFVVLAPGCSTEISVNLAERLRHSMPGELTCSVGVVEWRGDEPDAFLTRGDQALYEAKKSRRTARDGRARSSR